MKEKILAIATQLKQHAINSYYVGGCVRDWMLSIPTDDYDICLTNVVDKQLVERILLLHCDDVTPQVGQAFPVWIATIDGKKVDFALARTEKLVGNYRTDFEVKVDGVTIEEDLSRRDLTINAIAIDVITEECIDPYNGKEHLYHKKAHPVGEAFREDSLRVIRAARFISRFTLLPTVELIAVCKSLKPTDISAERVGMELKKVMKQAIKPSLFFNFLRDVGWLHYFFKEVADLIDVPQEPIYHPEGNAYIHTMHCIDEGKDWFTRTVMLCHDLGKATTTTYNLVKKRWQSIGHEREGILPTRNMLTAIKYDNRKVIRQIECLVELHMIRTSISEKTIRKSLRHLMQKGLTYSHLVEVCRCDVSGRPPLPRYTPDIGQARAQELLDNDLMTPIVTGQKLLEIGYLPDKKMGKIIDKALEWQDRGTLHGGNWMKMIKQIQHDSETIQAGVEKP